MKKLVSKTLMAVCLLAAFAVPEMLSGWLHAQEGPGGPGRMGGRFGGGAPILGTLTEITSDHLTLKTDSGQIYKVMISSNTHFMKDRQPAQASDFKVGDMIIAMGKTDESAKTVGAFMVGSIDPERARQMREMEASYGKTWLSGKITAINETKITITGREDKTYTLVVDENTSFKKRRDSITMADIKVGDMIRATGAQKNGAFTVSELNVMDMGPRGGGMMPPPGEHQPPQ